MSTSFKTDAISTVDGNTSNSNNKSPKKKSNSNKRSLKQMQNDEATDDEPTEDEELSNDNINLEPPQKKRKLDKSKKNKQDINNDRNKDDTTKMLLFRMFEMVNSRDQKLVDGYIRRVEKALRLKHNNPGNNVFHSIPAMVNNECLHYYLNEYFYKGGHGADIKTTIDNRDTVISEYRDGVSIYGRLTISSMTNKIHEWTFKIVKNYEWTDYRRMNVPNPYEVSPNRYPTTLKIGIGDAHTFYQRLNYSLSDRGTNYYSYCGYFGHKQSLNAGGGKYGPWYITGDKVSMVLDMSSCSISFKLNGKEIGVAYDNLKKGKDIEYKMFVYIHAGATIQLLSYKCY